MIKIEPEFLSFAGPALYTIALSLVLSCNPSRHYPLPAKLSTAPRMRKILHNLPW